MSMNAGRKGILLAGAVLILGGFGYLVYGGIGENLVFFLTPTELNAKGAAGFETPIKLAGQVVPGSVEWEAEKLDLRFKLGDGTHTYAVQSKKAPPQMFRDGQGVVVEGRLSRAGVFEANNLMVKHSNEYKAPPDGHADKARMYESLIKAGQ